jgi:hypothetical protein
MADVFQILSSHAIDAAKWDDCIEQSKNGLIYATTDYLNAMADNWSGVIVNDYTMVMPLMWRKKFLIKYCYDVPFLQQSGWFCKHDSVYAEEIIKVLFSFCSYGDYSFNAANTAVKKYTGIRHCNNYILDLSAGYPAIKEQYAKKLFYDLKKAAKENLLYLDGNIEHAISLYKFLYHTRIPHVREADFKNFLFLCTMLSNKKEVIVKNICKKNGEILATALLLKHAKRLYNIINCTTAYGRKLRANHFLFDNIIKEFSAQSLLLDFEGSDIKGIEHFYTSFGAVNVPYYKLHFNNLAGPLKLFKQ